jgi:multidrug efflux pump subunit AcrA (membrane-fusion protein)
MRRPHRSIEVFDISLMAVVTKAMGAFLVLMLLLMPYYSSGPIGQQEASDLKDKVDQVDKNIQAVISELSKADAEDLRKRLEEALKELEEARKLIAELQHANDALNAQVQRLEQERDQLAAQVAQAQQQIAALQQQNKDLQQQLYELNGNLIAGQVVNMDCPKIGLSLGLWTPNAQTTNPDKTQSKYVLTRGFSFGSATTGAFDDPGQKYNTASFSYHGVSPDTYMLIVTTRARQLQTNAKGLKFLPLQRIPGTCSLQVNLQFTNKGGDLTSLVLDTTIDGHEDPYAKILTSIAVSDDDWHFKNPTAAELSWLQDQIAHAEKMP